MKFSLFTIAFLLVLTLVSIRLERTEAKFHLPDVDFSHIDPVDMCLFACSMCYEKEELLDCANNACLKGYRGRRSVSAEHPPMKDHDCPGLEHFRRK